MDNLTRFGEGVHAGDAYLCCLESEKTSHLAMEVRWLERPIFILSTQNETETTDFRLLVDEAMVFVINLKPCKSRLFSISVCLK